MISENDVFKLNEMILSKNSCNSNISLKDVFLSKELIGIYISVFFIILISIIIKNTEYKHEILMVISLVILFFCFLYLFLVVLFMTIKSYYDTTIEILNVSKNAAKTFIIEKELKQKISHFIDELNSKDSDFPANYIKHLKNEINNVNNHELIFGRIQTLSLIGMVIASLNAALNFKELINKNNYIEIFIIVIPIIVSYWIYIEKKKINRINKIIYYVSEWRANLTPASTLTTRTTANASQAEVRHMVLWAGNGN
ncbi:hypothetical protein [Treponema denticola]|uniref:hypothetical protein n=1 Tax=Treponema denticola TaxID=158 RepID=UPI0020A2F727|nr:hypothetical protein [Treponema denticola]UTC88890.1 hypothetical protein E4N79_12405 [Treponema denticola]